jgi:HK97 family phage prohead protease
MEFKSISFEVKDFSKEKRTAVVAHAVYGNIDLTGDISTKGMFNSSWSRKDNVSFYFNHDDNQSPGKVLRTFEDDEKAYTEVKFGPYTLGNDVLEMVDFGVIRGASFGYETEKKDYINKGDKRVRKLLQVKHIETSLLTKQPANPLAGVVSYNKSLDKKQMQGLKDHVDSMERFCRDTRASDDSIKFILDQIGEIKSILSAHDTASTPLITDGGASVKEFSNALHLLTLKNFV